MPAAEASTSRSVHPHPSTNTAQEFERYFDVDDFTAAAEQEMDRIERDALAGA